MKLVDSQFQSGQTISWTIFRMLSLVNPEKYVIVRNVAACGHQNKKSEVGSMVFTFRTDRYGRICIFGCMVANSKKMDILGVGVGNRHSCWRRCSPWCITRYFPTQHVSSRFLCGSGDTDGGFVALMAARKGTIQSVAIFKTDLDHGYLGLYRPCILQWSVPRRRSTSAMATTGS